MMSRLKKIYLCVFLLVSVLLVGCKDKKEDTVLESGFEYSNGCLPLPPDAAAYRSETNIFEKDNVELTFYFGGAFSPSIEFEREHRNVQDVNLYFEDEEWNRYLIRHLEDNYISEEYRWTTYPNIKFNHSEKIKIPEELFKNEIGRICFSVWGRDRNYSKEDIVSLSGVFIYYKVQGDKVILSAKEIEE